MTKKALLLVDVQNDFCPGGSLAVRDGDQVVAVLNRYIEKFRAEGAPIFASRDWHPEVTKHFKTYGGVWPVHCVQNTQGAAFHQDLDTKDVRVISKGMDPEADSYSAFQGADAEGLPLADVLRRLGVTELYVGGLATDYCVKASVLDGLKEGLVVKFLLDGSRAVELSPGDAVRAMEEMLRQGAEAVVLRF